MSPQSLQAAIGFLLGNSQSIDNYFQNGNKLRRKFKLTKAESDYIHLLGPKVFEQESRIIFGRRFHKIFDFMPWTNYFIGNRKLGIIFGAYCNHFDQKDTDNLREIENFVRFAKKLPEVNASPFLLELLAYELNICRLVFMSKATFDLKNRLFTFSSLAIDSLVRTGDHVLLFSNRLESEKIAEKVKKGLKTLGPLANHSMNYLAVLEGIYDSNFVESTFSTAVDVPEIGVYRLDKETYKLLMRFKKGISLRSLKRLGIDKHPQMGNLLKSGVLVK